MFALMLTTLLLFYVVFIRCFAFSTQKLCYDVRDTFLRIQYIDYYLYNEKALNHFFISIGSGLDAFSLYQAGDSFAILIVLPIALPSI